MSVVAFDPVGFIQRYPEFEDTSNAQLDGLFTEATLFLNNTDSSPVKDSGQRAVLLNMIVAHLLALSKRDYVGRINQVTQGSITVQTDMGAPPVGTEAYWVQTPYGASFWAATASLRGFRYFPGRSGPQVLGPRNVWP